VHEEFVQKNYVLLLNQVEYDVITKLNQHIELYTMFEYQDYLMLFYHEPKRE
jgi:hypothetical protein